MTFGAFSGLAATFPLLIADLWRLRRCARSAGLGLYGPLVGSAARVVAGPLSDKLGGARVTHWAGLGMLASPFATTLTSPTGLDSSMPGGRHADLFSAGVGNASTFKQMPMLFEPRQAGGVIGFHGGSHRRLRPFCSA